MIIINDTYSFFFSLPMTTTYFMLSPHITTIKQLFLFYLFTFLSILP